MHTTSPLSALRQWLESNHLDGMIVPRADAWQSEYCAPYDEKLAWLTGFDGSAVAGQRRPACLRPSVSD